MREELSKAFDVKYVESKEIVYDYFVILASVLCVSLPDVKESYLDDVKEEGYEECKTDQF